MNPYQPPQPQSERVERVADWLFIAMLIGLSLAAIVIAAADSGWLPSPQWTSLI